MSVTVVVRLLALAELLTAVSSRIYIIIIKSVYKIKILKIDFIIILLVYDDTKLQFNICKYPLRLWKQIMLARNVITF